MIDKEKKINSLQMIIRFAILFSAFPLISYAQYECSVYFEENGMQGVIFANGGPENIKYTGDVRNYRWTPAVEHILVVEQMFVEKYRRELRKFCGFVADDEYEFRRNYVRQIRGMYNVQGEYIIYVGLFKKSELEIHPNWLQEWIQVFDYGCNYMSYSYNVSSKSFERVHIF